MRLISFLMVVSCSLGAAYYPPADNLRNQVHNLEAEQTALQQRLENFHVILENLQEQMQDQGKGQKEQQKKDASSLDIKILSLENMAKSLAADLKQLQNHANETAQSLQALQQKQVNLESVIQTLMEALQVKAEIPNSGKAYKVKTGDSLEKIARAHGTTVQAIKNLNQMSNDKIVVGKTLLMPE